MGPVKPVFITEEDEQHSHGHKVDYLQHIKGSNTGRIFTWFSSSLLFQLLTGSPQTASVWFNDLKNKGKKKMLIYCKGNVYVNYVYDFVKRHSLWKNFPSTQNRSWRPSETICVQLQSTADI